MIAHDTVRLVRESSMAERRGGFALTVGWSSFSVVVPWAGLTG